MRVDFLARGRKAPVSTPHRIEDAPQSVTHVHDESDSDSADDTNNGTVYYLTQW